MLDSAKVGASLEVEVSHGASCSSVASTQIACLVITPSVNVRMGSTGECEGSLGPSSPPPLVEKKQLKDTLNPTCQIHAGRYNRVTQNGQGIADVLLSFRDSVGQFDEESQRELRV